jgi:hypothetical protein
MLVKHALSSRNSRIIRRSTLDNFTRLNQKSLRIILLQQPPIAKMRKKVHKQSPSSGPRRQLDVMVLYSLHDQAEHRLALLLPDADKSHDGV